jgi:peptidoglycan hydrolase-like protein with peptidoglycan-binding domain
MGQQLSLPEENHDAVRRILGMHDHGEDVISLQHALNRQLYSRRKYRPITLTWKLISKRLSPTLWGYSWAPGALHEHLKHHVNPFKHWKPNPHVPKAALLREDGKFGKKTREAVIKYQHKVGLPDDGIAGPEVWEHLFPFWVVKIIVVKDTKEAGGGAQAQVSGQGQQGTQPSPAPSTPDKKPPRPFIGSPFAKTTMDNIAQQLGAQLDKNGLAAIFVMQATWKTEEDPNEIVPGHWEHTGGFQVNTPVIGPGQNVQAYYQLTRAEIGSIKLADGINLSADVWVQPTVQAPLDSGTRSKPNLPQVGVTAGATVYVEFKGDENKPTVKVFVQGAGAANVDSKGNFDAGGQAVVGVSTEFDVANLFGGGSPAKPQRGLGIGADPPVVVLKPGGSAQVKISVTQPAQKRADFNVVLLPTGVSANMFDGIPKGTQNGVLHLSAAPNAPAADTSNVIVGTDLAGDGDPPRPVQMKLRVIVAP